MSRHFVPSSQSSLNGRRRNFHRDEDGDSGVSSSSQRMDEDEYDFGGAVGRVGSRHSASSPASTPADGLSEMSASKMMIIPRCAAPRDRAIAKYPPPFHPDATPNSRINFHVAVKKACVSHHSKGVRLSKAIVIGESAVGKTALVNRFCRDAFDRDYKATIGVDFEVERFDVLCQPYNLQMWDTAGQERFRCIAASYYRGAHIIVVVFDLTKRRSLSSAGDWVDAALKETESALIFLVGAKRDLLEHDQFDAVEPEAIRVANRLGAELWITSAKTGLNVNEFFHRVAALGFESLVLSELEAENESARNRQIGNSIMQTPRKMSTIDLRRREDLFERDSSTRCCKIGK